MTKGLLSLVLATVGRTTEVQRLVFSLAEQSDQQFELLVVDQNADDRLLAIVEQARQLGISVLHLRMAKPSLSGARNLGISRASGEFIAFPDDDCWYEPNTVEAVRGAFESHPRWGGVVGHWVEQSQAAGGYPSEPMLHSAQWHSFRADAASSISLFFKSQALQLLGGFDQRLGVGQWFGAAEETDLILRALSAGVEIGRCPEARVHHHFGSLDQRRRDVNWRGAMRRGRGTGALFVKHRVSWRVFLRGFFAPPIKAMLSGEGIKGVGAGLAVSTGRIQGALKWLIVN